MWSRFTRQTLIFFSVLTAALIVTSVAIIVWAPVTEKSAMFDKLVDYKAHVVSHDHIVVIGDSTGLSGVDPILCTPRKVMNLCLYGHAEPHGWYNVLRNYLQKNDNPHVCIIYFTAPTPASFYRAYYEGIYAQYRYFHWGAFYEFTHKYNPINFLSAVITILTKYATTATETEPSSIAFVKEHKGYMAFHGTLGPEKINSFKSQGVNRQHLESGFQEILDLKQKIEKLGIRTLIYLHGIPRHDEALPFYKDFYQANIDNAVYTLSHKYFNDHTHLNHKGARINTKKFLQFLEQHGF